MQQANNTKIKAVTTRECDDSVQLHINLAAHNLQVNGRKVNSITMYADAECSGDLAVNWEEEDDSTYKHNTTLMLRSIHDSNNNTETMSLFYWDGEFTSTLQQLLLENGFSTAAAQDVCTSEWGMQDVGRASYDAFTLATEMLAAHNIAYEEA
jgi:hypothetical protein